MSDEEIELQGLVFSPSEEIYHLFDEVGRYL